MQTMISHDGLTIDFSRVVSVLAPSGYPIWSGKVVLVFRDRVDGTVTKITANFSSDGLLDFEGEPEADDPIYEFCEAFAQTWAGEILDVLGRPSYAGAKVAA